MTESKQEVLLRAGRAGQAAKELSQDLEAARAVLDAAIFEAVEAGATWIEVQSAAEVPPYTVQRALRRERERRAGGGA